MKYLRTAKRLCPVFTIAFAIACQQGDGQSTRVPRTVRVELDSSATSRARAAADHIHSTINTDDSPEVEAQPVDRSSFERVALHRPETRRASSGNGLDQVSAIEPVGDGIIELQALAGIHPDSEVRKFALEKLADADNELAFESLVTALEDEEPDVVLVAIEELQYLDDRAAIDSLAHLARSHDNEEIREAAREAIEFLE